jgi:hypothetical protein
MYFIISINKDNIYHYNYKYLFNYKHRDLLDFLLEDTKTYHTLHIFNDINNNFNLTIDNNNNNDKTVNTYIKDIKKIILLYSDCKIDKGTIVLIVKNYIGILNNGLYFHFKINNFIDSRVITLDIYISMYYNNIISNNKNIFYSNDLIVYTTSNLREVCNNIENINIKCKLTYKILQKNIQCNYLIDHVYNKIIQHLIS